MATAQPSYAGDGRHTTSYYAASANPSADRPELVGDQEIDICIVGAGYSGLSTGLFLAEKGHRVAIVEGARVGWGASGRNGGQIVNGLNAGLETIEKRYGRDTASFVAGLVQEGGQIIRQRVAAYDIKCDLKESNVFAALTGTHMRELEARLKLWAGYGIDSQQMLSRDQLQDQCPLRPLRRWNDRPFRRAHPSPESCPWRGRSLREPGGRDLRTLARHACGHGCRTAGHQDRKGHRDMQHAGAVRQCLSRPRWFRRSNGASCPSSTQIMATEPLGAERAQTLLPSDTCIEDVRYILDYYRLSGDKRLLFGGGTVYGGADPRDIEAKLRKNMEKVFPHLKDVKIDYAWSGNFALSFSRVPQMGRIGNNTYFAHGYSGHGVTGSHTFGRILAEAIHGDISRFDVFAGLRWYPFPGGRLFRVPYSVVGSWWYGLRDRLGI